MNARRPQRALDVRSSGHRPRAVVVHTTVGSLASAAQLVRRPQQRGQRALPRRARRPRGGSSSTRRTPRATPAACTSRPAAVLSAEAIRTCTPSGSSSRTAGTPTASIARQRSTRPAPALLAERRRGAGRSPSTASTSSAIARSSPSRPVPGNLDVERLLSEARRRAENAVPIVCLLPARNAAADLPGYLESVAPLCDARGRPRRRQHRRHARSCSPASPLVRVLLRNPPRRETYAGWDDGENRNRLLARGRRARPRLDPLPRRRRADRRRRRGRRFASSCRTTRCAGCAYGLQHHRMWGEHGVDPRFDLGLPAVRVSAGPARFPTAGCTSTRCRPTIPRAAWLRTTIRVRHLGSIDAQRRAARRAKYARGRPDRRVSGSTPPALLAAPPSTVRRVAAPGRRTARARRRPPRPAGRPAGDGRPAAVCLLPVRNARADLPGYLESRGAASPTPSSRSTTAAPTAPRELLEADPLVRDRAHATRAATTYAGWDDAANRSRLLDAAAELEPALGPLPRRRRAHRPATTRPRCAASSSATPIPGVAYGFRVHRMIGDAGPLRPRRTSGSTACSPTSPASGSRTRPAALRCPIPTAIPRERWREDHACGSSTSAGIDRGAPAARASRSTRGGPRPRAPARTTRTCSMPPARPG